MSLFKRRAVNKHKIEALNEAASRFLARGQFAEAAENYEQAAAAFLDDNVLIFVRYSHEAFRTWLKAKTVERALQQAHEALRVLDASGWLKKSMEEVLDLKQMIDELEAAGYGAEADAFARELDEHLSEVGLMLKPRSARRPLTVCPACGAPLPDPSRGDEMKCSFCGFVVPAT
jgi:hypothetical protein